MMTEERKAMLATRKKFAPVRGQTYTNEGCGGLFYCMDGHDYDALFVNVATGWSFLAHCVGRYDNGTIDWDYSTGGRFI